MTDLCMKWLLVILEKETKILSNAIQTLEKCVHVCVQTMFD